MPIKGNRTNHDPHHRDVDVPMLRGVNGIEYQELLRLLFDV